MKTLRILAATLAVGSLALPVSALAYDWNAETGFFQWLFGRQGYFTPESGHTLATACAYDEVAKRAERDPSLKSALEQTLSVAVPKGKDQITYSVPYQLTTFGNWGNEIFTNSGLEGRASHEDAGAFLGGRYHKWLSSETAKKVYLGAQDGSGYSSTYYLHAQLIDGKTQDQSFDAIERHVRNTLAISIDKLKKAEAENIQLPNFTGAFKGLAPKDCNERCQGITVLGSVFHLMEDSSATCSPMANAALKAQGKPGCLKGDGHTIIEWTPAGRPQVVTLSNDEFYQSRTDLHGNLDGLYTGCDTQNYAYVGADGRVFDFNPKLVNASILAEVSRAVANGENTQAAVDRIWNDVISDRFAKPAHRQAMPKPPEGPGPGRMARFGEWLGERSWQPITNYTWTGLGRLVAWVDHKFGDADGWNEGVATAWGTTGGTNVARNANTRPTTAAGSVVTGPRTGGGVTR